MLYRLQRWIGQTRFNHAVRGVINTPEIICDDAPLIFLSQLCHRDVLGYLLALKSIHRNFGRGRVVIIDDGSLTDDDKACLSAQINGVEIRPITTIDTQGCPRGGTWERLWAIVAHSPAAYVIQVDADLLGLGAMPEVAAAVAGGRSFTLGTRNGQQVETFTQASARVTSLRGGHVQPKAEAIFKELPDAQQRRYVRACSGFAGFAQASLDPETLSRFSTQVEARLGNVWHQWGSEQVSSNMLVANAPDPLVLAHPTYANYDPEIDTAASQLLHFVGTYRFHAQIYAALGRSIINQLTR